MSGLRTKRTTLTRRRDVRLLTPWRRSSSDTVANHRGAITPQVPKVSPPRSAASLSSKGNMEKTMIRLANARYDRAAHLSFGQPVPSSSWLFSVPWAVIVPMAVGGPFRIHSNITPINAPTTGPTI